MASSKPGYETGWHTTGTLKVLPSISQVAQRLDENPDVILHGIQANAHGGWWSYDAIWMVGNVRVRGRVNIHNQHPNDPRDPAKAGLDPRAYDPKSEPLDGYFHVYAEADRPWQPEWPSPLHVFLDRKLKPSYVTMGYGTHNPLHPMSTSNMGALLNALAELPWTAVVLIHDELDMDIIMPPSGVGYEMPLISRLPSSLYGRVIDVRVMGETTFQRVNAALKKFGTSLPRGGAAILLSAGRRKGVGLSDLHFPMEDRPFVKGGDITALTASLSKLLTSQVLRVDDEVIDELRNNWTLFTGEEQAVANSAAMQAATSRIKDLEDQIGKLRSALDESRRFVEKFKNSGQALIEEVTRAVQREREALEELKATKRELNRLLVMIRDSDLGKAMAARDSAEAEAEAASELLDEQTEELNAARQENARLRRELARAGATAAIPPQRVQENDPDTWDELLSWASRLEYVALGDVESEINKLRGQTQERSWVNQAYRALRALEDYARMKKERGSEEVPHFGAYLKDPRAEHAIPWTKYTANESKGVMMNSKFVAARTLRVPEEVDPDGKVVMEAHIRIGSGKPPAPRLHFHDDTSGTTGKIYVGHIGPHLPNYQTN
ncbi:hypothetical protein ACFW2V_13185 [Streptomyces sp. NPDC058947]|uniref:hypothetical protein n=1 Tax=Streptomyces sp. NPDC058947 TaxID=3346675 RepID=UPI0036A796B3